MSARNWKYLASERLILFETVMSHWFCPGPQQIDRGVVEKLPGAGSEKLPALMKKCPV